MEKSLGGPGPGKSYYTRLYSYIVSPDIKHTMVQCLLELISAAVEKQQAQLGKQGKDPSSSLPGPGQDFHRIIIGDRSCDLSKGIVGIGRSSIAASLGSKWIMEGF